jgi:hypothetical protein
MKPKRVKFDVVQIWHKTNQPHTINEQEGSVKAYAIKIGDDFFLLGTSDDSVYIDDLEVEE